MDKFCVNCIHYHRYDLPSMSNCHVHETTVPNLITGKPMIRGISLCINMRSYGYCGPEGTLFEEKKIVPMCERTWQERFAYWIMGGK